MLKQGGDLRFGINLARILHAVGHGHDDDLTWPRRFWKALQFLPQGDHGAPLRIQQRSHPSRNKCLGSKQRDLLQGQVKDGFVLVVELHQFDHEVSGRRLEAGDELIEAGDGSFLNGSH